MKILLVLVLVFTIQSAFPQKFDELARTPPMGWNSWNQFGCRINDTVVREMADAMIESHELILLRLSKK